MSNDPRKPADDANRPARASAPAPRAAAPAPRSPAPSRPAQEPSGAKAESRSARPVRPQAPARPATGQRLEGVLYESQDPRVQSIDSIAPSGLSTSTYLPSARRDPEKERQLRRKRQLGFRQTVIPSLITLGVSMLAIAAGWFLLDPGSALRDNSLGMMIPLGLLVLGVCFSAFALLLVAQSSALRRKIASDDKAGADAAGV